MKNRLMDILATVNQSTTLTALAKDLFLSQPYISRQIGDAERQFNVKLIERTTPIRLTYAGERLLSYLKKQTQLNQMMKQEMLSFGKFESGALTLGVNQPLGASWFTSLLPGFYHRFPQMHLSVQEVKTSVAQKLLPDGQMDLFIGKTFYNPKVVTNSLGRLQLVILVPKTSRLFRKGQFWRMATTETINQMNGEPFIRIVGESRFVAVVDNAFRDNGVQVENRVEVADSKVAIQMALMGLGCVTIDIISARKLSNRDDINILEFPPSVLTLDFSIIYRKTISKSDPLQFLVSACLEQEKALTMPAIY